MTSRQTDDCLLMQIRYWWGNSIEKDERYYYRSYLFILSKYRFVAFHGFSLLQGFSGCRDRCRTSVWDNWMLKNNTLYLTNITQKRNRKHATIILVSWEDKVHTCKQSAKLTTWFKIGRGTETISAVRFDISRLILFQRNKGQETSTSKRSS